MLGSCLYTYLYIYEPKVAIATKVLAFIDVHDLILVYKLVFFVFNYKLKEFPGSPVSQTKLCTLHNNNPK